MKANSASHALRLSLIVTFAVKTSALLAKEILLSIMETLAAVLVKFGKFQHLTEIILNAPLAMN